MVRKMGRPRNREIHRWIKTILEERPFQNPRCIKNRYKELTGRGVGYDTIKRALDLLLEQEIITELTVGKGRLRRARVYSLS